MAQPKHTTMPYARMSQPSYRQPGKEPEHDPLAGHWITRDKYPDMRRAFDMNRDPMIKEQMLDLEKTEKQRRDEQSGRGSGKVKADQPKPAYRPPPEMRPKIKKEDFDYHQMEEQHRAAMKQATPDQSIYREEPGITHAQTYHPPAPSRSR